MNNDSACNTRYGLQVLEQLAQDHESDDVLRRRLRSESLVENVDFMESSILKSNVGGSGLKGIENSRMANGSPPDYSFKCTNHTSYSTKKDISSSPVPHLKSASKNGKAIKDESDGVLEDNKDANTEPATPVSVRRSRSNFTVPQPFNLSMQNRTSIGDRPGSGKWGQEKQKSIGLRGEVNSKAHIYKNIEPKLMAQTNSNQEVSRQAPFHFKLEQDDDVASVSSIRSRKSTQTPKANASRFTSTDVFNFQSDARAEKRKEFYSKLQERLNVKEEVKAHLQAKTKKELEDEIKVLRRRLVFKASPMPSFYKEGPPQKVELPKVPTTRAKSPNFSRRQSHSGFSSRPCERFHCEAGHYDFKSPHKHDTSVGNRSSSFRSLPGSAHERLTPKSPPNSRNLKNVDLEAPGPPRESVLKFKMKDRATVSPLPVSSDLIISNEEERDHVAKVQIKQVAAPIAENNKTVQKKLNVTPPTDKNPQDVQVKGRNELKVNANTDDRIFMPTASKIKSDGNGTGEFTNKATKKERLKGIASYFTTSGGKTANFSLSSTQTPEK